MSNADDRTQDIKNRFKQFAQPLVDSLDSKLRQQVDERVDERVATVLDNRLSVLERAVADLDRSVRELERRLND
jgi:hypothetical protein